MAALTGNSVGSSYLGLLKTTDNAALGATEKNLTDGAGNASTLSMGTASASFTGNLDLTNATVTGLPGGSAGLISGTGTESMKNADNLTTEPAVASGNISIALGRRATASGERGVALGFASVASNFSTFAMGTDSQANGDRALAVGNSSRANGLRSIAFGVVSNAYGSYSIAFGESAQTGSSATNGIAIGKSARSSYSGLIAIGNDSGYIGTGQSNAISIGNLNGFANGTNAVSLGYYAAAKASSSIAIGDNARVESSAYTNSIAIGHDSDTLAAGAVALGNGVQASVAECTTVNMLQIANYANLNYADDTAAAAGGVALGQIYHTDGAVKVRIA